jgi:prepilin-type N-terminal cleavage/methylation domain-containing protein
MSATGNNTDAGFTLVELLVALAIVALAAAGMASFWPSRGGQLALQTASQTLAAELRQARGQAIAQNRTIVVDIDAVRGNLPKGVAIADSSAALIFFRGDGTTAGGEVAFRAQSRQATVRVARLSGQVSVVE